MNIRQLYQDYHTKLIAELTSAINDVIKSVDDATAFLPEEEVMDIFDNHPVCDLIMCWTITKSLDEIRFSFEDIEVGNGYKFDQKNMNKLIEFLDKYYPGIVFCRIGEICLPDSIGLMFEFDAGFKEGDFDGGGSPSDKTKLTGIVSRFVEDIQSAFSNAKVEQVIDQNHNYYECGGICIRIQMN